MAVPVSPAPPLLLLPFSEASGTQSAVYPTLLPAPTKAFGDATPEVRPLMSHDPSGPTASQGKEVKLPQVYH